MHAHPTEIPASSTAAKEARQRVLAKSTWFTVPGTFVVLATAYALVPPLEGLEQRSTANGGQCFFLAGFQDHLKHSEPVVLENNFVIFRRCRDSIKGRIPS
jgi:hypothetical protein